MCDLFLLQRPIPKAEYLPFVKNSLKLAVCVKLARSNVSAPQHTLLLCGSIRCCKAAYAKQRMLLSSSNICALFCGSNIFAPPHILLYGSIRCSFLRPLPQSLWLPPQSCHKAARAALTLPCGFCVAYQELIYRQSSMRCFDPALWQQHLRVLSLPGWVFQSRPLLSLNPEADLASGVRAPIYTSCKCADPKQTSLKP